MKFSIIKYYINFCVFLLLFSCSKNDYSNISFDEIVKEKIIADGTYPGKVYFLDSKLDTLNKLKSFSNVWVIVEDNLIKDVDFGDWYIPGRNTKDKEVLSFFNEFDRMKYFQIVGDKYNPRPYVFKQVEN